MTKSQLTTSATPHFLLVGNGPYLNRGCEAIVRGTMRTLCEEFGKELRIDSFSFVRPAELASQIAGETDPRIRHHNLFINRFSSDWLIWHGKRLMRQEPHLFPWRLRRAARDATAALLVGGDNYTFDYGFQPHRLAVDRMLQNLGVPVVLWGASVGPFEGQPDQMPIMLQHLRSLDAIFIRESLSRAYLTNHNIVDHVYSVGDPAFLLPAEQPSQARLGFNMPDAAIGLNLSPLLAKRCCGGDLRKWTSICIEIVRAICRAFESPVVLIPHVTSPDRREDDFALLAEVARGVPSDLRKRILLVCDKLSAAETKWVISRCRIFAGARTHSTIAAFSMGVPSLSFSYSLKAQGLNKDLFGTLRYCLDSGKLNAGEIVERLQELDLQSASMRKKLQSQMSGLKASTQAAGQYLKEVIARKAAAQVVGRS